MARGVRENEVFDAADALLGAGERPTVERVRLSLGRGSPNTIGPLLDTWWGQLAERLQHRLTLPAVPEAVGTALAQVWELALDAGRTHAEAALAPDRTRLAEAMATIEARLASEQEKTVTAEAQRQQAIAAAQAAEAAFAVSEQRGNELAAQVASLRDSVEEANGRRNAMEAQLQAASGRLEQERFAATSEREALQTHLRQVEDRAFAEIDQLRQELKAAKAQLTTQAREHTAALRSAEQAQRAAERAQHAAERDSAAAQARLQALVPAPSARQRSTPKKGPTTGRRRASAT